ncbi:MAG TPA: hypothetical protein VFE51_09710 [Verrucomicrobiae bacterium]|nr:hypothetical protein [Verrucomicrobiae bacterium]
MNAASISSQIRPETAAAPAAIVSPGAPDSLPVTCRSLSIWLVALLLPCGCTLLPQQISNRVVPAYHPQNVFVSGPTLPPQIRRVAVLPVSCDEETPQGVEGRNALEPVLLGELDKIHKFEVRPISSAILRKQTGRGHWGCEEALPPDFLSWLKQNQSCDAVLFCKLTFFRGNPPLAVGWRMRLVDIRTASTLWATDEIFDAGLPSVRAGVYHYQAVALQTCQSQRDDWLIENSPRQFGQYTAAQLLATLPGL